MGLREERGGRNQLQVQCDFHRDRWLWMSWRHPQSSETPFPFFLPQLLG